MNEKRFLNPITTLCFGAIDGLLVGLALETVRITYLNYELSVAAEEYRQSSLWADFTSVRWEPVTPFVSILVFAAVGYVVRKCFVNRRQVLAWLWFILGGVAVGLGYFMSTLNPDLFSFLWLLGMVAVVFLIHRLWKAYPGSPSLFWATIGISAVIVVAVGTQLAGMFFYWPSIRKPSLWLMGLVGVVAINGVFGVLVQLLTPYKSRSS